MLYFFLVVHSSQDSIFTYQCIHFLLHPPHSCVHFKYYENENNNKQVKDHICTPAHSYRMCHLVGYRWKYYKKHPRNKEQKYNEQICQRVFKFPIYIKTNEQQTSKEQNLYYLHY